MNPRDTTVIILAGGLGTRLRGLHPDCPKPMIPCAGWPFLEWTIQHFRAQGFVRFVVSLGYRAEVAEEYLRRRPADGTEIVTVREREPMGTGGAIRFAWATAAPDCAVVATNGDSLLLADFSAMWAESAESASGGAIACVELDDASRFGTVRSNSDGRLVAFEEKRPGPGWVNGGIYYFQRELLARFPEKTPLSIETEVFPRWLEQGVALNVFPFRAPFLDIGTPDSLAQAERFLRTSWPWKGWP